MIVDKTLVFVFVNCIGRPVETRATLESLSLLDDPDKMRVHLYFAPTEDMSKEGFETICDETLGDIEVEVLNGAKAPWADVYVTALEYFSETADDEKYTHFWWWDNDNISNPDCLRRLLDCEDQAGQRSGLKAGVIGPQNIPCAGYTSTNCGVYTMQSGVAGFSMFMSAAAALSLPVDAPHIWGGRIPDFQLCEHLLRQKFTNMVLTRSAMQHIGKNGGLEFVPDEKVRKIWERFNGEREAGGSGET